MVKEFNLSDKRTEINYNNCRLVGGIWIREKDVKEFIKVIKEDFELFKLQQFGIGVGMSPKFNVFLDKLNSRAGDLLL